MNTKRTQNQFLKLSIKKNRINVNNEIKERGGASDIIMDESFEKLKSQLTTRTKSVPKHIYSPIVIDESSDEELPEIRFNDNCTPRKPSRAGNVSFNNSIMEISDSDHPSFGTTWSPAQNIMCATPKSNTIPSTPRDKADISQEECSLEKIQMSQKKILDELYGDVWKSLPNFFKSKKVDNCGGVTKRLDFDDEDEDIADKENFKGVDAKHEIRKNECDSIGGKTKKKLYTEKIPNTPEPRSVSKKRNVQSATKKAKQKTVSEILKNLDVLNDDKENKFESKIAKPKAAKDGVERLSFMASLAVNIPTWRCNVEALSYKDNFKSKREQLSRRLFEEFNERIFDNQIDNDMIIMWDTKLRSTAGITTNRLIKNSKGEKHRTSSIKLSTKVVDCPMRLRDTLVHELCHAATWLLDHELKAGHGPLWKKWATKALRAIPELEEISRCHNLTIHFRYSYKCTQCGYSIQRHSKSIDVTQQCCGYCRGTFQLILNKKTKDGHIVSTPARQGQTSEFALYVKEMYGTVKAGKTHAQAMKILGQQFTAMKKKDS